MCFFALPPSSGFHSNDIATIPEGAFRNNPLLRTMWVHAALCFTAALKDVIMHCEKGTISCCREARASVVERPGDGAILALTDLPVLDFCSFLPSQTSLWQPAVLRGSFSLPESVWAALFVSTTLNTSAFLVLWLEALSMLTYHTSNLVPCRMLRGAGMMHDFPILTSTNNLESL